MKKIIYISALLLFSGIDLATAQIQSTAELNGKSAFIRSMEAFSNQEYAKSVDLLLSAYELLGKQAGICFALTDSYLMLNDLPNAALYGKQAVELDPTNKWYRFKLAQVYRSAGENQATLKELNTLLEYHPNDFEALFMLADTYKDYGEFFKSNRVLDRALNLLGPNRAVYLMKFQNYEALGIQDSAIVQLEALRDLEPDNLNTLNSLSEYYLTTDNTSKAKIILKEALVRNSRDPQTLINLSGIYIDEQKWDSAGTLLGNFVSDTIISNDQKLRIAQYLYTRHLAKPQDIQLRIETARILDLFSFSAPDYGPAFSITGQFYAQNNDPEKALEALARATQLLPGDEIAWRQRLQLLLSQNRLAETVEVGIEADEQVPDDSFVQFFVGSAYVLQDDNEAAIEWLNKASRSPARRPFKSIIYGTLGDAFNNVSNFEEADRVYELALRYDPQNHNAMNNYAYNLSVRGVNLDRAKELALKAIELDPESSAYLDTVGWVYFKLADYDRARRFIKASIDTGSASAEVFEHLGDTYEKLDDMDEARKWWQKAFEMDSTRIHLQDKI